jgi:hypothetical protein
MKMLVESFLVGFDPFHEDIRELRVGIRPDINHLVVTFVVGDETHVVVVNTSSNFARFASDTSLSFSPE